MLGFTYKLLIGFFNFVESGSSVLRLLSLAKATLKCIFHAFPFVN